MRNRLLAVGAFLFLAVAGSAFAQPANDSISVTAQNVGVFQFDIVGTTFDFGQVDSNGTTSSTGVNGVRGASGATYTQTAATTWTASSAPTRTVRIFNASTTSTINWGSASALAMQIPTTGLGSGTSCGYITFVTNTDGGAGACSNGNLVHGVSIGNGSNAVTGNLDFQLTVNDTDLAGSNTWTVVLTATGS